MYEISLKELAEVKSATLRLEKFLAVEFLNSEASTKLAGFACIASAPKPFREALFDLDGPFRKVAHASTSSAWTKNFNAVRPEPVEGFFNSAI